MPGSRGRGREASRIASTAPASQPARRDPEPEPGDREDRIERDLERVLQPGGELDAEDADAPIVPTVAGPRRWLLAALALIALGIAALTMRATFSPPQAQ